MIRLYNVLRKFCYLPNSEETKLIEAPETEKDDEEELENAGLNKALDTYRKLIEKKTVDPLTEKEQEKLENRIKEIEERVIPITIRRVLPNGDYQNIPINYFIK